MNGTETSFGLTPEIAKAIMGAGDDARAAWDSMRPDAPISRAIALTDTELRKALASCADRLHRMGFKENLTMSRRLEGLWLGRGHRDWWEADPFDALSAEELREMAYVGIGVGLFGAAKAYRAAHDKIDTDEYFREVRTVQQWKDSGRSAKIKAQRGIIKILLNGPWVSKLLRAALTRFFLDDFRRDDTYMEWILKAARSYDGFSTLADVDAFANRQDWCQEYVRERNAVWRAAFPGPDAPDAPPVAGRCDLGVVCDEYIPCDDCGWDDDGWDDDGDY